jgi:hypothetical protein
VTDGPAAAAGARDASADGDSGKGGKRGKDGKRGKGRRQDKAEGATEGPATAAAAGDDDLPAKEYQRAREAGARILEFLGAWGGPDEYGYYTVWDAADPDRLPQGSRKAPL